MKLYKKEKLIIYDLIRLGKPYTQVSRKFQFQKMVVQYLVYLLDVHESSILEKLFIQIQARDNQSNAYT